MPRSDLSISKRSEEGHENWMIRRLFTIASALSLLLFVATGVLWARSYWIWDNLGFNKASAPRLASSSMDYCTHIVDWHTDTQLGSDTGWLAFTKEVDRNPIPTDSVGYQNGWDWSQDRAILVRGWSNYWFDYKLQRSK
jgi:hypothetical protein